MARDRRGSATTAATLCALEAGNHTMNKRRRFKQADTLQDRLLKFAEEMTVMAAKLPDGKERGALLKRVQRAHTAAQLEQDLHSPT
jgi:Tfp pilus assembly protein PilO